MTSCEAMQNIVAADARLAHERASRLMRFNFFLSFVPGIALAQVSTSTPDQYARRADDEYPGMSKKEPDPPLFSRGFQSR